MTSFVNLAFYKFIDFDAAELPPLKKALLTECQRLGMRGTILLAPEGLNGVLAATSESAALFKEHLQGLPKVGSIAFKESESAEQPFTRMLVRLKKEIISMGRPEIKPSRFTGPRLTPTELKQWLDEKREIIVLDTRNDYEVRLGTFTGALDLDLKTFRQFPRAVRALPTELKDKTIVSFCTGGIRCEKASALLMNEGFTNVYQLDGGILKYFEQVGASHYDGECFVFDYRVAVDSSLKETGAVLCYNCQNPVTLAEQQSPQYVAEVSCPYCNDKPKQHKERIAVELAGA
ncbi:MAG: sulfurtransferase [Deltaproteobacteria bacterium]|nr:sulfurtransferase [Deltaproteobacteria bacterium]